MTPAGLRAALDAVTREVVGLSADAQARVSRVLAGLDWEAGDVAENREAVVSALAEALPAYVGASAQAGADLYDAVREAQVGEALGGAAEGGYDPAATEGAVRAVVRQATQGEGPEAFARSVLSRVDYEVRRAANVSVARRGARDPLRPRYARVPSGGETCEFCIMLASRGAVYRNEEVASHCHAGCDCRVVPSFGGVVKADGYDQSAYMAMWRKISEMRDSGMPEAQRRAVSTAMRDRLIPSDDASPADLVSAYQRGMDSAWGEFRRAGKTEDYYAGIVGAFLSDMAEASGCRFSAEFMARPDGNEIWAATKLAAEHDSIVFRYADFSSRNPDYLLDGEMAEIKTPTSRRKVTNRLCDIADQFGAYPGERKVGIISTIYLDEDADYVADTARRFVTDGTLDEVIVIRADGSLAHVRKE